MAEMTGEQIVRMVLDRAPDETDWREDWNHENGAYKCRCIGCGVLFIGHKRRIVCRKCTQASAEKLSAR